MRSREARKYQGNLEAAIKGNSHGGLAGMQMGGKILVVFCLRSLIAVEITRPSAIKLAVEGPLTSVPLHVPIFVTEVKLHVMFHVTSCVCTPVGRPNSVIHA